MEIDELARIVSDRSGIEAAAAQKVLEALFATLGEELAKDEKVEVPGLGTFVRKRGKESGDKAKTLFRSWRGKTAGKRKGKTVRSFRKARKKMPKKAKGRSP